MLACVLDDHYIHEPLPLQSQLEIRKKKTSHWVPDLESTVEGDVVFYQKIVHREGSVRGCRCVVRLLTKETNVMVFIKSSQNLPLPQMGGKSSVVQ